jgi:hypothetical protein
MTATACALGWILALPPFTTVPTGNYAVDTARAVAEGRALAYATTRDAHAPITAWENMIAFDTAAACEQTRQSWLKPQRKPDAPPNPNLSLLRCVPAAALYGIGAASP